MEALGDNLKRLMGLHSLSARHLSPLIELSPQAISELLAGKRTPHLHTINKIATFFEIPMGRLLGTPFEDLLGTELADLDRYRRVEVKIPPEARERSSSV